MFILILILTLTFIMRWVTQGSVVQGARPWGKTCWIMFNQRSWTGPGQGFVKPKRFSTSHFTIYVNPLSIPEIHLSTLQIIARDAGFLGVLVSLGFSWFPWVSVEMWVTLVWRSPVTLHSSSPRLWGISVSAHFRWVKGLAWAPHWLYNCCWLGLNQENN